MPNQPNQQLSMLKKGFDSKINEVKKTLHDIKYKYDVEKLANLQNLEPNPVLELKPPPPPPKSGNAAVSSTIQPGVDPYSSNANNAQQVDTSESTERTEALPDNSQPSEQVPKYILKTRLRSQNSKEKFNKHIDKIIEKYEDTKNLNQYLDHIKYILKYENIGHFKYNETTTYIDKLEEMKNNIEFDMDNPPDEELIDKISDLIIKVREVKKKNNMIIITEKCVRNMKK